MFCMKSFYSFFIPIFIAILPTSILCAQSPGNVTSSFWVEANSGVEEANSNPAENGDRISSWLDQSGSNNYTQSTSGNRPFFRDNTTDYINYNPVVEFVDNSGTSSDTHFDLSNPETGSFDLFMVIKTSQSASGGNTNFWAQPLFYGGDINSGVDISYTINPSGQFTVGGGINGDFTVSSGVSINNNEPRIIQVSRNVVATSNSVFSWQIDGGNAGNTTVTATNNGQAMNGSIKLGLHGNGEQQAYDGFMAEQVVYNGVLSSSNRSRVESYLAIKYGITLNANYVNTSGSTIYNISSYNQQVIGIGRDDNENLLQKQSHSSDDTTRIYVGTLASSNSANASASSAFGASNAYIISGHDNGRMCAHSSTNSEIPSGLFSRIQREWKITNSNFNSTFNIDLKLNACGASSINTSHLRLLVDSDGNFSNATTYAAADGLSFSYSAGTNVVTITGISTTQIPLNGTRYITLASTDASTPLPIELLDFNVVEKQEKQIAISWSTASELNNDFFIVQRLSKNKQWEDIAQIDAQEHISGIRLYNIFDPKPMYGQNFYRLKQVDIDGQFSYSTIKSVLVNDEQKEPLITLFPNPVHDLLTIQGTNEYTQISIFNLAGVEVTKHVVIDVNDEKVAIRTESLPTGMYILELGTKRYRFVKNGN